LEINMATNISVSDAREGFADLVNRVAYGRERVRVVRRGREVAAIVPMEDIELLEAIEDELDLAAARDALADPANARRVALEELRARLAR
jgi:prevent-host-death family protein